MTNFKLLHVFTWFTFIGLHEDLVLDVVGVLHPLLLTHICLKIVCFEFLGLNFFCLSLY